MKKISDQVSLTGKAERISIMEFRSKPGEVLDKAMFGLTIIVTRYGKNLVYICPFEMPKNKTSIASLEAILSNEDSKDLRVLPNGQVVQFLENI